MTSRMVVATSVGLLLLFSGCLEGKKADVGTNDEPKVETAEPPEPRKLYVVATDVASPFSDGVFKMRQTGGATVFTAKKDETINVTIKNAVGNQYVHNLVLDGYDIKLTGVKDSTVSKVFNATKTGSFKYYCDLMLSPGVSHRTLGMEGTFTVS